MRDNHAVTNVALAIGAAALAADNVPVAVDRMGYNSAELVLAIGIGGIVFTGVNKIEFVVTHSDDNVVYNNVTDADMIGVTGITTGIVKALTAAHASAAVYRFGYRGDKRYLKVLADFSGTHATPTPIAATVLLGHPSHAPAPNQP